MTDNQELDDELLPEYNLKELQVRKVGPQRTEFAGFVQLAPDVAEIKAKFNLIKLIHFSNKGKFNDKNTKY